MITTQTKTLGTGLWLVLTLVFIALLGINSEVKADIYQPEGLNMPGAWNNWTNPPANCLGLASYTEVTGGRVTKIATGITRWQTILKVAASGGDVVGGTYEWLFTSGPSGNAFANKWTGVTVSMNTLQSYTFGNGTNNSITVANGKWYTMNWKDNGYAASQAIFMATSAVPVDLSTVSVPASVAANQPATITLTTSATPAAEEKFYLLYTTNNWATSALASFTMTGGSGTATIPAQLPGAIVKYYAFSSTVSNPTGSYDLYSIKINNNGGSNYQYTVSGLSVQAEILSFSFTQQTGPATITSASATVAIEVAYGTSPVALVPTITVSAGATISPASGVARNFTAPVTYLVTAENGTTTKTWTVNVTVAGPPVPTYGLQDDAGVNLPTFTYWYTGLTHDTTEKGAVYDGHNLGGISSLLLKGSSIKTWKTGTGDVTGAQFKYKVWATSGTEPTDYTLVSLGWTSNDGGGLQTWAGFGSQIAIDKGLDPGTYNLKVFFTITGTGVPGVTENGPFNGTFQILAVSTAAEILSFNLDTQTGPAVINTGLATVTSEVANGTGLTALTPAISISPYATISPLSGVARDFTNPVTYIVTAQSGATKVWTVTVTEKAPTPISWANLQWPGTGTILPNQTFYVYQQAFAAGITLGTGQGAGIQAWLGYSSENTDPSTWTNWIEAPYFGEAGNNDEYRTDLGTIMSIPGTYYYASRFKLNNQAYVYGGFQSGFWNGTSNISGVLTVNAAPTINWANLQWPPNGSATVGNDYNVYARVYAPTVTPGAGHGAGIQAWIGYSTENSNPNTWTNWVSAVYQGDDVDNDEYYANIGTAISTPGTYYYASRFQLNTQGYVYGGYNGGYWDGTNNVSGVFTANATSRTLNLNVMLEGLFVSESNTMHEANNDPGNPQYGVGIADHITVELHNSSDYSAVEYTATDVVLHTDGTASVAVPAIYSGSYFITIVHRNSLTSTSAVPVSFADATVAYNFSDAASKAYGNNLKLVGTTYVVYAGDLNQDGVVDGNDLVLVDNNAATFLTGYKVTDVNGDGVIDSSDIGIVTGNVNSFVAVKKP